MDDSKYTVTISGPGFSVTAVKSFLGACEDDQLTHTQALAWALSDAIEKSCAASPLRSKIVLAQTVAYTVPANLGDGNEINKCTTEFYMAAYNLDDAWDRHGRRDPPLPAKE